LNKGYRTYPLIRRIWNLAAKEMSLVDELIIWGYSLPPTEFYSYWLMRQARESKLRKLIIINPDVINKYQRKYVINRRFVARFYDLFRRKISEKSLILYDSFMDYDANEDVLKKYELKEIVRL